MTDFVVDLADRSLMTIRDPEFLPGVARTAVIAALSRAGGNELDSGKLESPESSAALAVNGFGWFLERPDQLPPFPCLPDLDWPAAHVDIERCMRFPWRGGRHPWLDAAVETPKHLIGVESKRFEPFCDTKNVVLSAAYDRDVWGGGMTSFTRMRDALRAGEATFTHLDAAQLLKHAFGLVTEGRRVGKAPTLLYLFAEPEGRGAIAISSEDRTRHRAEIAEFAGAVAGADVAFVACSWREWLASWTGRAHAHADALTARFEP